MHQYIRLRGPSYCMLYCWSRDRFERSLPDADAVDEYHIEEELEVSTDPDTQLVGEECRAEDEPAGEEDEEGGVVARELQLRRLPVREVAVHLPRRRQLRIGGW